MTLLSERRQWSPAYHGLTSLLRRLEHLSRGAVPNTYRSTGVSGQTPVRHRDALLDDRRATEGLPITLVIAVVVGAAAVALLWPLVGDIEPETDTEVTLDVSTELLTLNETGDTSVTIAVVTENGQPVEGATLVVREGSAPLASGPADLRTGPNSSEATLTLTTDPPESALDADVHLDLRTNQNRGTLEIEVVPPTGTRFVDEHPNPDLTVVAANVTE